MKKELTNKKTAVIGGDARQLVIADALCKKGAEVFLCGFDQLNLSEPGYRKTHVDLLPFEALDAIIFPGSVIGAGGYIKSSFSAGSLFISEHQLLTLPETCLLFTGIKTAWSEESAKQFIYLFEEDDIAISNSIPTVEGILLLIIQHTDFTIHGSRVVITGGGRVGKTAARVLHALGASVTALSSDKSEIARMIEMGVTGGDLTELKTHLTRADIWINTIPSIELINQNTLTACHPTILIIELASNPSAAQKDHALQKNISYLEAPSLPGLVAPKTAGEILAKAILNQIINKGE
ncbi:hypothetical protein JMA_17330 [Jeotgalibacillus malaysiensis]|uniref:Dipicolinate synthase subunit A n=1 Tax=Jeotgalibacillus malaysiensis TaxID=1508404 RepID=A0A0B5AL89_9BACL|nr:dipicolinate synthase subunit DpsA [Jeotgalibacillus malaysiensis]AJD91050.1 hypothetical protein JMA_17330 [Jeotgalibacillus malaysiensis]